MTTVGQQNFAQVSRATAGKNGAFKTLFDQQWQVTAVVQVRMGQQYRVDQVGCHWQRAPVAQPQLLVTLKQATVHQQAFTLMLNTVFGAGDGTSSAEKCDGDAHDGCSPGGCFSEAQSPNVQAVMHPSAV